MKTILSLGIVFLAIQWTTGQTASRPYLSVTNQSVFDAKRTVQVARSNRTEVLRQPPLAAALSHQSGKLAPSTTNAVRVVSSGVTERGQNHLQVQTVRSVALPNGKTVLRTNTHVRLETGMHFYEDAAWKESSEEIEITSTGAVASRLPFKVHFPADIMDGAITVSMPDGQRLRSRPVGVGYASADTGKSVMVGLLKSSVGVLVASNRLIYPNCLRGDVRGDLVCTVSKAGLESDIVIREQPASWPSDYGMAANENVRLQVFTEFFEAPTPQKNRAPLYSRDRMTDETIDFGGMQIVRGKAWKLGDEDADGGIFVAKQWVELQDRRFLVEQVPFRLAAEKLQSLPRRTAALEPRGRDPVLRRVSDKHLLPKLEMASRRKARITLASLSAREAGFVLDYVVVSSQSNYRFKGDTTYYVSGSVNLSGTTVIEGGAVVKFAPGTAAKITCNGPVDCQTGPYRPAVFTARDAATFGEILDVSTSPLAGKYGNGLTINQSGTVLKYLRFCYANSAIRLGFSYGELNLANLQVLDCLYGVDFNGNSEDTVNVDNTLFYSITNVTKSGYDNYLNGQHVTVDHCLKMFAIGNGNHNGEVHFYNCVLADVAHRGNADVYDGSHNGFYAFPYTSFGASPYTTGSSPFQTPGGGNHYLKSDSSFRAVGTTAIDASLLASLAAKTTTPPIAFPVGMMMSGELTLFPQIPRYTSGAPDLGYYYDVLDYTTAGMSIRGGSVTVLPGTAVAFRNDQIEDNWKLWGFSVSGNGSFISRGHPDKPNVFASAQFVQEGPFANPRAYAFENFGVDHRMMAFEPFFEDYDFDTAAPPLLDFRFSHFYFPTEDYVLWSGFSFEEGLPYTPDSSMNWNLRDSRLQGGHIMVGYPAEGWGYWLTPPAALDWNNNLFDRMNIVLDPNYYLTESDGELNLDLHFAGRNNLLRGCRLVVNSRASSTGELWQFTDNLFDKTSFEHWTVSAQPITHDYNGYWKRLATELETWQTDRLDANHTDGTTDGGNDQVLAAAPADQTGPFGGFYLGTDYESSRLLSAGSRSAADAGLFHYTSLANQTKDGGQAQVNIGLHYVATASSTATTAKDSDSDGIPDYVENWHGDGDTGANRTHTSDETDWQNDHTETGVADAVSPVYDDIDLDGDGMVGRIEKALNPVNPQPLVSDNPLALVQITTGKEPDIAGYSFPLNFASLASIGTLQVLVGGRAGLLQNTMANGDGSTRLVWNASYSAPMTQFLQAQFILDEITGFGSAPDLRKVVASGPIRLFNNGNVAQFSPFYAQYDASGATFFARVAEPSAQYTIQVRDPSNPSGDPLKTITGSTSTGVIRESWANLAISGGTYSGTSVDAAFAVTLTGSQASQTQVQRLNRVDNNAVLDGEFTSAYLWPDALRAVVDGKLWRAVQYGVVDPFLKPTSVGGISDDPYSSWFNDYSWWGSVGKPGRIDTAQRRLDLLSNLGSGGPKNFFYIGHASSWRLTDRFTLHITNADIQWELDNYFTAEDGIWNHNPYRFVFLFGCKTANNPNWAHSFGIVDWISTYDLESCPERAQAFVGWVNEPRMPYTDKEWDDFLGSLWLFSNLWMNGYTIHECIFYASMENPPMSPFHLDWPLGTQYPDYAEYFGFENNFRVRIYGYAGLTKSGYQSDYDESWYYR